MTRTIFGHIQHDLAAAIETQNAEAVSDALEDAMDAYDLDRIDGAQLDELVQDAQRAGYDFV